MCTRFWNIFEKAQNFVRKYSLSVELLIIKYRRQKTPVSVTLISADTGLEVTFADRTAFLHIDYVRPCTLFTRETPHFIAPTLRPANSPDLSPSDYRISGSCRSVCTAAGFMTSPSWSRVWSKGGNISTMLSNDHQWSRHAVTFTSSSLHFSTRKIFLTQTLTTFDFCTSVTCPIVANSGHFMSSAELAKLAVTFADVDRCYWKLVVCLRLNVALVVQNLVKIQVITRIIKFIYLFIIKIVHKVHDRQTYSKNNENDKSSTKHNP